MCLKNRQREIRCCNFCCYNYKESCDPWNEWDGSQDFCFGEDIGQAEMFV